MKQTSSSPVSNNETTSAPATVPGCSPAGENPVNCTYPQRLHCKAIHPSNPDRCSAPAALERLQMMRDDLERETERVKQEHETTN